jgi:uncharacterized protein YndB with AHSA1/START domain
MAASTKHDKINNVSTEAVELATGRDWDDWIEFIDGSGGERMDHRQIVVLLANAGGVDSGWWQQMVTVGYEHAKGRRVTGETAATDFQIGVQRTIPIGREALWDLLTSGTGTRIWMGTDIVERLDPLEPGARYGAADGTSGEFRTIKPGHRLRLTYQDAKQSQPSVLQLTLNSPGGSTSKTALRFHQEKLASERERERMREHWTAVLDEIEDRATGG